MSRVTRTRAGVVAALALAAFALPQAAAGESGGQPTPEAGGTTDAGPVDPAFKLSARRALTAGRTLRIRGTVPGAEGRVVRIERRDWLGIWKPVAASEVGGDGAFKTAWKPDTPGRYVLRGVLGTAQSTQTAGEARSSATRPVTVYNRATASWYGPGFYGRRTACGQVLRHTTLGVAHRTLPCGSEVAIAYRGRSIVVPVIDRGPFAHGVHWDLTAAAAGQLGVTVTSRIGALPLSTNP
jgi:rare lipoprotein A